MTKLSLLLACLLSFSCAHGPTTAAHGDSSASVRTCTDILTETTTTTSFDGSVTVTVAETCEGLMEEASVGGAGSGKLYETVIQVFGIILSVGSIVIQAVR